MTLRVSSILRLCKSQMYIRNIVGKLNQNLSKLHMEVDKITDEVADMTRLPRTWPTWWPTDSIVW